MDELAVAAAMQRILSFGFSMHISQVMLFHANNGDQNRASWCICFPEPTLA